MRGTLLGEDLLLAIDVGTSGVKTGLFTADGHCLGQRNEPLVVSAARPGWNELNLEQVWEALVKTVRGVVADHDTRSVVTGIGLSVASPTVVAVGPDGRPLSGGLTYSDSRAQPRLEKIRRRVGDAWFRRLTGNRLTLAMCSGATMLHLADQGRTSGHFGLRVGHLNSYLVGRLAGRWVIDWTNASYTGLVDIRRPGEWSAEACEALEFPEGLLPEIVAPWEPVGQLSNEAAESLGLDRSVVVIAGAADTACSAYGVGCVDDGAVFESAGTSGVLTVCRSRPSGSQLFMNRSHVLPGRWLSHGAMSAAGAATRWLRDAVFPNPVPDAKPVGADGYAWLEAEAARSTPGAGGVVFLPYLLGERTPVWDPDARGAWIGMSVATERRDLIRAVFESAGYGMGQLLEIEEEYSASRIGEVLIIGGGARSHFWTRIKADITGKAYLRAEEVESAARGAAMLAAVGIGAHRDVWSASAVVRVPVTERIEPTTDASTRDVYGQMYKTYTRLYPVLKETFSTLSQLRLANLRTRSSNP